MKKLALVVAALLLVVGPALGQVVREFTVGDKAVGWFTNLTGGAVTGFHLEFDQPVTILYKVEVGGVVENLGAAEGVEFDFAGELVSYGLVELGSRPRPR
ncbi:hypothetical protein LR090_00010 [Candidatus Bipolaricaulota bacterium]|nr:hypothetical protein [Candidatus Bipolaricaulota bacterium]